MKREEYIDRMAAKLKEWNAEIEKLEVKAQETSSDAKKEINKEIQDLRTKKQAADYKLEDIKKPVKSPGKSFRRNQKMHLRILKVRWKMQKTDLKISK